MERNLNVGMESSRRHGTGQTRVCFFTLLPSSSHPRTLACTRRVDEVRAKASVYQKQQDGGGGLARLGWAGAWIPPSSGGEHHGTRMSKASV
jgi:hypothetical protein